MKYLAITRSMAEWLLPKVGLVASLYELFLGFVEDDELLRNIEFTQNAIRISYDERDGILAIWHLDYLSGTGAEDWGVIKWSGEQSITSIPSIGREVFERSLYVVVQRLQGLMLDGSMIHRVWDNGAHTLLAGRGAQAHQLSIGYFESTQGDGAFINRSCVLVGPEANFQRLSDLAFREGQRLRILCQIANSLIGSRATSKRIASKEEFVRIREALSNFFESEQQDSLFGNVEINAENDVSARDHSRYLAYTYEEWLHPDSPLGEAKRRILSGANVDGHPLRILGPGGSGKTLLMLLLAVSKLRGAKSGGRSIRVLYIVHSKAMEAKVRERFELLMGNNVPKDGRVDGSVLVITTLAEYCLEELSLDLTSILDVDGDLAKGFQLERVYEALVDAKESHLDDVQSSVFLSGVFAEKRLIELFARLVSIEISVAIKGHGLEQDRKRYVESERSLSLLHANLSPKERGFVFNAFLVYHKMVFEGYSVLDPDDIAISLAGRLRTPLWQFKRRHDGFDYVFVDEAQLFNENERRLFSLLTKQEIPHVPVALALDQAQATYGQSSAGLSTLGITGIANESLSSVHRSTEAIVRLAFFVIQKSTELFGPDFPDFTKVVEIMVSDGHHLAARPVIEVQGPDSPDIGRFVLRRVRELRKGNIRQIAVICYTGAMWKPLQECLEVADLPFQVISERGARFPEDQPMVSLVAPSLVGGQEFDAVILVGLEAGVVPPVIRDNSALANAVEQQAIRDIYLGVTRARYRVMVVISKDGMPTQIIGQAKAAGLID